jgi:hypothetical protein
MPQAGDGLSVISAMRRTRPLAWKDADPYIPILKQAKAEFARLQ